MKSRILMASACALLFSSCACEIEIASSDVPQSVLNAFSSKYAGASDVEWEVEKKKDGKLYFEAEFKIDNKKKGAYFRPDGTFSNEE